MQAALVDYEATAVDERSSEDWRVFFTTGDERDRAQAALHVQFPDLSITPVDVPDENWAARSQASLRAIRVGTIIVAPPWDVPDTLASPDSTTSGAARKLSGRRLMKVKKPIATTGAMAKK